MDENIPNDSEVSPREIIKQMKLNIFNNYYKYNNALINIDYLLYRPSIFALIHNISNRIGFKSQTFFLSIYYLDILHLKHKKIDLDLKTISLACLLLASKYSENDQNVPILPAFVALFNSIVGYKDFISKKELFFAEVLICKLLEYKLNYYTIYDFNSFFFGHGIIKIEQLKEINNGIKQEKNDFNDINMDIGENSFYIRKVLEKIYRKSRYYLDNIINNGNICLKYSSLIISVVIMKKSVEDILIKEQKIQECDLKDFKEKTSNCFKEIMKEIYQIDYESMEEYQNLIKENELQIIFQENNKRNTYYNRDANLKFSNNKENSNNLNFNNRYQNNLNKTLNENIFTKKFNISQKIDIYNYKKRNQSRIEENEGEFLYQDQYKKERISVPKRYNLNEKYNYLSHFNSSFTKSLNISKNISLSKNKEKNKIKDVSLKRNSQINNINKYMHTYTNQFYKKGKGSNSINKAIIKNTKNMNINDIYDDNKNLLNIIDNNQSLSNENNILNTEMASKERNYEKYTKLILKKRFFNRINRANDYSLSQLDDSNTFQNIIPSNEKNPNKLFQKPYFKKVIKNITNYTIKPKSKFNSFYSTIDNNMYKPIHKKQNKLIILNPFPLIQKESKETILDNELNIDNNSDINNKINNEKKQDFTSETTKNINKKDIIDKNYFMNKKYLFNQKRKIYSNNILFNSMAVENRINNDKKEEKNEILLTSNNDYNYIAQNNERQKLLFLRMKNINNKLNFKNSLNNTEIKSHNNEKENTIFKRKFLIPNNIKKEIMNISMKENPENNNKDKIYENQIANKNIINNKKDMNKNTNFIIKELQTKNLRNKFNSKKTEIKNIQIKNEKVIFPKSSIFKLINRTKTSTTNKLDLSKEESNSDLINKFITRNTTNNIQNQNRRLKNMQTLELNNQENNNNMIEPNNLQKMIFNTIDNTNSGDKKEINNNVKNSAIHGYHYRNYMKNKIRKEKETDINKTKNKNNNNDNSKTIVINNNININFNNKIDHSNTYNIKKNENINKQIKTKINDNEEFLNKIINNRNNNKNNKIYEAKGTIEYTNVEKKISHNNLSSLVHRIPFYKKSFRNNKDD